MRVLLIDNKADDFGMMSLRQLLASPDRELLHAETYSAGAVLAAAHRPEMVIVRVRQASKDEALALGRRLSGDPLLRQTLLLAITFADDRHGPGPEELLDYGFHRFLCIPVSAGQIEVVVNAYPSWAASRAGRPDARAEPPGPARVLYVDNDHHQALPYALALKDHRFEVAHIKTAGGALKALQARPFDLALLDIMMPAGKGFRPAETAGGFRTGLALAREVRRLLPRLPLVALTYSEDPEVKEWFGKDPSVAYLNKATTRPTQLPRLLRRLLKVEGAPLKVFVVHGRDHRTRSEVVGYLRDTLRLGEVIVLVEEPSLGKTVIEKFEYYAGDADFVFVLMTPDDVGHPADAPDAGQRRARQNVIFEYGFFLGALRRQSGRVFQLHKGACEIPSDIAGVICIDISDGIGAADQQIRKELRSWLV
jgi:CheY-like chemotaxis protein